MLRLNTTEVGQSTCNQGTAWGMRIQGRVLVTDRIEVLMDKAGVGSERSLDQRQDRSHEDTRVVQ